MQPHAQREIYLDHNATGPVHPEVAEAILPLLSALYGNPSAPYALGMRAREAVSQSRRQVADLLGCSSSEVVFTSGGTESNNLAIKGAFAHRAPGSGRHVVTSAIEHPSVAETCAWLTEREVELTVVSPGPDGRVDPEDVKAAVRPDTFLVALMHANNETGALQPVADIGAMLRDRDILFHVDGVQAAGRIPVDVRRIGCDSYSVSAHKFGGLKGAGALFVRDRRRVEWTQQGGHQERGSRAGTENVPGIVAMGKAAEVALRDMRKNTESCLATRAVFDSLVRRMPVTRLNGHATERLPNTTNLCCLYADAMSVVLALSVGGLYVGSGSACASHTQAPSRILKAMGLSDTAAYCSIRISTGPENTLEEARYAADRIAETVEQIRLVTAPDDIGTCDDDCPCFLEDDEG